MQIKQEGFLDLIGTDGVRFIVPVFQRVYSWDTRQCEELWEDILSTGAQEDGLAQSHFMGMLLYSADSETWNDAQQLNVIDGQQRMTTLSLLLRALARYLGERDMTACGVSADDIFERFLLVESNGTHSGKLTLSSMDRATLYALMGVEDMPENPAGRLIDNLELFFGKMQEPGFDVNRLWRGLSQLEIASVLLAHDDSPQLVFESLNSKGMSLSTADRVRNFIVVTDEANRRTEGGVFERCWLPFERLTSNPVFETGATTVLHAWLAERYRSIQILDKAQIYGLFKSLLRSEYKGQIERLLNDAGAYARMLVEDEERRIQAIEDSKRWLAGKPKDLISEYKMFGD